LTTSDGEVYNVRVEESERLKRLQRKYSNQIAKDKKKRSNNSYRTNHLIRIEYEKLTNRRVDAANKIIHKLLDTYSFVYMQDENIKEWQADRRFSRTVQYSCMGLIKSKLKHSNHVKMISKWFPSTKMCYVCRRMNVLSLSDRMYQCECGLVEDRDVKAAKTIMLFGKNQLAYTRSNKRVPMESREFTAVEIVTPSA
jgi:putative transposase